MNGIGDEGAARDLLALAERRIEPVYDFGPIADVLAKLVGAPRGRERSAIIAEARRLAGDNTVAIALVKHVTSRER